MASRPPELETTLPDGTRVRFRPIGVDDTQLLREGIGRLSERSRRLRFHSAVTSLSDAQLRHLVDVDHHDQEALIADVLLGDEYVGVGVARYARAAPDDGVPEFAMVVEDAWQGRGVGRLLLRALFAAARRNGFERLTAEVLAENDRMLRLLREEAGAVTLRRDGSAFHVTLELPPRQG
ncbi:MAG: GNAT family N-acetyltransferase [Actinobacteria bacterium]|nr:GNAT family N-acetyltransferase [Actinomycetota bacterium]